MLQNLRILKRLGLVQQIRIWKFAIVLYYLRLNVIKQGRFPKEDSLYSTVILLLYEAYRLSNFFIRIHMQACFGYKPYTMGGTGGVTTFTTFDTDSSFNMAIGGSSQDSAVVDPTALPNAFLLYVLNTGTISWAKTMPTQYNDVVTVSINSGGTMIGVAFDSGGTLNQAVAILNKADGNVLYSYVMNQPATMTSQGLRLGTSSLYIAFTSSTNIWRFMKFDIGNAPITSYYTATQQEAGSKANCVLFQNDNAYIGGTTVTAGLSYASVVIMDNDDGFDFKSHVGFLNTAGYSYKRLAYLGTSPRYMIACGDNGSNVIISRHQMSAVDAFSTTYVAMEFTGFTQCMQIQPETATKIYYMLSSPSQVLLGYLDPTNANRKTFQSFITKLQGSASNYFPHARYASGQNFYFIGNVDHLMTSPTATTYNPMVGVALFTASTNTNLDLAIPTTLVETGGPFYSYLTSTVTVLGSLITNAGGTVFSNNPITTLPTVTTLVSQIDSAAVYTLGGTTLVDQTYVVNQGGKNYQFALHTVTSSLGISCTDATITYSYSTAISATNPTFASFAPATRTFTMNTNLEANVGTHNITFRATLNNGQFYDFWFLWVVQSQCIYSTITASTLVNQTYTVSNTQLNYQFTAFSKNISFCDITYTLTNLDGSEPNWALFTMTSLNRTVGVYTLDNALEGVYPLRITGTITLGTATTSQIFNVTVRHQCYLDVITAPTISNQIYYWNIGNLQTLTSLTWTHSIPTTCPDITYTVSNDTNGGAIDPIFQVTGTDLTVQTASSLKAGTYTLRIVGAVSIYTSVTRTFTVTITNNCIDSVYTTSTISNREYIIGNTALNFDFPFWTTDIAGCGTITYSAKYLNNTNLIAPFMTFDPSLRAFNVYEATNLNYAGTYTIVVTATLEVSLKTTTQSFTITVYNPCLYHSLVPSTVMPTQTLYINNVAQEPVIPAFTTNASTSLCGVIRYTVTHSSGVALDSAVFTFTEASRVFRMYTDSEAKALISPYLVKVTAYHQNYLNQSVSYTFTVNLIIDCNYNTMIAPPDDLMETYVIEDPSQDITIGAFDQVLDSCGAFTYSCTGISPAGACNSIFTLDPTTGAMSVYAEDIALNGTYRMYLNGHGQIGKTGSMILEIYVAATCRSTRVVPYTIPTFYYNIYGMGNETLFTSNFTQLLPTCPNITYTFGEVSQTDGTVSTLPNIFKYHPIHKNLTVDSDDPDDVRTYVIRIFSEIQITDDFGTAVVTDFYDFTVIFSEACILTSLQPTLDTANGTFAITYYTVGQGPLSIVFRDFVETPSYCPEEVIYTFSVAGYAVVPSFITVNFTGVNNTVTINTGDANDAKKPHYNVTILARKLNTDGTYTNGTLLIPIILQAINLNAPNFVTPLESFQMAPGEKKKISLPDFMDGDGDEVSLVRVSLGSASSFVTGTFPNFEISPLFNHLGEFKITIVLTDDHPDAKQATYTFTITVKKNETEATSIGVVIDPTKDTGPTAPKITDQTSRDFKAQIRQISMTGEVQVAFSDNVRVPANFTNFNSSVLVVEIVQSDGRKVTYNYTWQITEFTTTGFKIQLKFSDAGQVSRSDKDQISITFIQNGFFTQASTGLSIEQKAKIKKEVPKQLRDDSASAALAANGEGGASVISNMMYGSLAINLVMAASLQLLWGMINVLQIIINMPLLDLDFPMNAVLFYSLLGEMANFDILPSDDMNKGMGLEFDESPTPERFQMMGYESSNAITNLGSMFLYLVGLGIAIVVVIILKILSYRSQKMSKVYYFFADRLLFNIIIRMLLEGFMEFFINSCLNLYQLKWGSHSERFSSLFACGMFFTGMMFPVFMVIIIVKRRSRLEEKWYVNTIGALYAELRPDSLPALMYNVMFILRRIIFSGIAFLLSDFPFGQIQLLILKSLMMITFLGAVKPFEHMFQNYLEIYNEICILGASYHLITLTNYMDDPDMQYMTGWALIAITVANMIVNIGVMMYMSIKDLIELFKKYKHKLRTCLAKRRALKAQKEAELKANYYLDNGEANPLNIGDDQSLMNPTNKTQIDAKMIPDFESSPVQSPTSPKKGRPLNKNGRLQTQAPDVFSYNAKDVEAYGVPKSKKDKKGKKVKTEREKKDKKQKIPAKKLSNSILDFIRIQNEKAQFAGGDPGDVSQQFIANLKNGAKGNPSKKGKAKDSSLGDTSKVLINSRRDSGFGRGNVDDDLIVEVNYDPSRVEPDMNNFMNSNYLGFNLIHNNPLDFEPPSILFPERDFTDAVSMKAKGKKKKGHSKKDGNKGNKTQKHPNQTATSKLPNQQNDGLHLEDFGNESNYPSALNQSMTKNERQQLLQQEMQARQVQMNNSNPRSLSQRQVMANNPLSRHGSSLSSNQQVGQQQVQLTPNINKRLTQDIPKATNSNIALPQNTLNQHAQDYNMQNDKIAVFEMLNNNMPKNKTK